jgi:hypothetical protein
LEAVIHAEVHFDVGTRVASRPKPFWLALAKLYEDHAQECIRAAGQTDDRRQRDALVRLAYECLRKARTLRPAQEPR